MSAQAFVQCALQAAVLGFEVASESSIVSKLKNLQCYGKTAMRDAIYLGTRLMIDIKTFHNKVGMPNVWNFMHIVITDGEDTSSEIPEYQLMLQMGVVGQLIKADKLKTIYIGVDLDENSNAEQELETLAELGGPGAELKSISVDEMDQIFHKIVISLKQRISVQQLTIQADDAQLQMTRFQAQPQINIQKNRYLVLFTIDVSGSMEGKRHQKVVNALNSIISTLGDDDLVCGIVFNNECKILSKLDVDEWNQKYYQIKQQQMAVQQLEQLLVLEHLVRFDQQLKQQQQQERLEELKKQEQKQQEQKQQELKQLELRQKQLELDNQQLEKKNLELEKKNNQFSIPQTTIDPAIRSDEFCKCQIF